MKNVDKAITAGGIAILFTGGVAAGAILSSPAIASAAQSLAGGARQAAQMPGGGPGGVRDNGGALGGTQLLAAAATYIGISEADLRTELSSGTSLADVATGHGKTRDGLIAALTDAASKQIPALVDQKGTPGGLFGRPGGPGARVEGDPLAAAATYLGVSADDLRTKMTAGQTLAASANATSGKNRDGLIQALVADATAKIDQAQAAGRITTDQATREKADLTSEMTRLVDSTDAGRRGHR
ncbi:MAG: hypothetical protein M3O91_08650 [Chloroflexota bacterium]|nr:hypothetical protein [Chloroflexota bacterium]